MSVPRLDAANIAGITSLMAACKEFNDAIYDMAVNKREPNVDVWASVFEVMDAKDRRAEVNTSDDICFA